MAQKLYSTSPKYDIAIAMGTYFDPHGAVPIGYRKGLYEACIDSLQYVDWCGMKVVLVLRDDCSMDTIAAPMIRGLDVNFFRRPFNLSRPDDVFYNLKITVMEAMPLAHWIWWIDSDGLIAHDGPRRMLDLVHEFPNARAYGGFNSPLHPTIEDCGWYVKKKSLTEHGTLFRSGQLRNLNSTLMVGLVSNSDGTACWPEFWPCVRPSVVQHTGVLGVNNINGNDFDLEFKL